MKKQLLLLLAITLIAFNSNAQINSVALVGEASLGWPASPGNPGPIDTHQMTSTDGVNWSLSGITLTTAATGGGVKFRANNDWAINWGSSAFPSGIAASGGSNISCLAGTYDVTFNSTTGAYSFNGTPITFPTISIIGDAAAGWAIDVPMSTTDGINYTLNNYTFVNGFVKFRQDNSWAINWGFNSFPSGTATSSGNDIPVTAGVYNVTFNKNTRNYAFTTPPVISVIGDAAAGWGTDVDMQTTDWVNYTLSYPQGFSVGLLKFREDHSWNTNWGDSAFPNGTATPGGSNVAVTSTGYNFVSFNKSTGNYSFVNLLNNDSFTGNSLFSCYPNPTNNSWNFNSKEVIESIEILDFLGKSILKTTDKSENIVIDASKLSNGIYFAKIAIDNSIQTIKLIRN